VLRSGAGTSAPQSQGSGFKSVRVGQEAEAELEARVESVLSAQREPTQRCLMHWWMYILSMYKLGTCRDTTPSYVDSRKAVGCSLETLGTEST
jgi:hypothetical protein